MTSNLQNQETNVDEIQHRNEVQNLASSESTIEVQCHVSSPTSDDVDTGVTFKLHPNTTLFDFEDDSTQCSNANGVIETLADILGAGSKEDVVEYFRERADLRRRGIVAWITVDTKRGEFCFQHAHEQ